MSDVILFKEDIDRLNGILQHLVHETKVLSAILVNKDTRLLASQGTLALFDMSALAALIVGSFASTQGIAGLIGEKEFSMMSHCGKSKNLLIMLVDDDTICAAIFDRHVSLSTVSSSIAKHIEELRAALLAIKHNMDVAFQGPIAMPSLSLSQDDVEKGIDNFFETPASQDQAAIPAAARNDLPETAVKKPPEKQFTEKKPAGRPEVRPPEVRPPEVRPEVPPPQETRQLEFAVALSRDEEKAGPDKFKASELDKSLSSNTTAPSPYKNIPPPSNTEYLYFTSMNFLKNKAKQRLSRNKKNNEKNIISRFFNRGRPV
jgi:predicted regulator of Ras-like GTPase activity (Roadblock/LC7/MglB family)